MENNIKDLQEKYPNHLWADKIKGYSVCCRRCFTTPPHPSEKCKPPVHYAERKNYSGYTSYCGESIYWDEIEDKGKKRIISLEAKKTTEVDKVTCWKCLEGLVKEGIIKVSPHYILED